MGKGSIIDHAWANRSSAPLVLSYDIQTPYALVKGHRLVHLTLDMSHATTQHLCFRNVGAPLDLYEVEVSIPVPREVSQEVRGALLKDDVNASWQSWSVGAEHILLEQARLQTYPEASLRSGRGRAQRVQRVVCPRAQDGGATTLQERRLLRGLRRAVEVGKAAPGHRRDRAWAAIGNDLSCIPSQHRSRFEELLGKGASNEHAARMVTLFEAQLAHLRVQHDRERLAQWRLRMRQSTLHAHKWLKQKPPQHTLVMQDGDSRTIDAHRQLAILSDYWFQIYHAHRDEEPSLHELLQNYGPHIRTHHYDVPVLTAEHLIDTLASTPCTTAGPDGWSLVELKFLSRCCPELFHLLAAIFNHIEQKGQWPEPLLVGETALLPKLESEELRADALRPITVLSAIYRLWSRARWLHLKDGWVHHWLGSGVFGYTKGKGPGPVSIWN